jgi:hypothetical protein
MVLQISHVIWQLPGLIHLLFMTCCQWFVRQNVMTNCMLKVTLPYSQYVLRGGSGLLYWQTYFKLGLKYALTPLCPKPFTKAYMCLTMEVLLRSQYYSSMVSHMSPAALRQTRHSLCVVGLSLSLFIHQLERKGHVAIYRFRIWHRTLQTPPAPEETCPPPNSCLWMWAQRPNAWTQTFPIMTSRQHSWPEPMTLKRPRFVAQRTTADDCGERPIL